MRDRRKRAQKDADQVAEMLQSVEEEAVTLAQARTLVEMKGRPISTDLRTAFGVLADEGRIVPLCDAAMVERVPEETVRFRYED